MVAKLHLAKKALALHLSLQRFEGLVDIVIADENLHANIPCLLWSGLKSSPRVAGAGTAISVEL